MNFIADKQTLEDLNLLGKYKPYSIYSIFNKTETAGGEKLLEAMFRHPLSDAAEINRRSRIFQYFEQKAPHFPFSREEIIIMEDYLGGGSDGGRGGGNMLSAATGAARKKLSGIFVRDEAYDVLHTGILTVIAVLDKLADFLGTQEDPAGPYEDQALLLRGILADKRIESLRRERQEGLRRSGTAEGRPAEHLSLVQVAHYDHLFRHLLREKMETIIRGIYQLDVNIAVSTVSRARDFSYARALPKEKYILSATALRHPGIDKGIANPLSLDRDSNMLFLTGANMAGKSTFMKAFGIAVYMAHMGFPVAARGMEFSVRDGIYSSINVPDNLSLGFSHFYAEVLRVRKVAEEVSAGKDLVIIFDELFKGTNVKDAYDATLAVTEALSEYRNCFFIISTHIIEAGEALRRNRDNLQFAYLPTVMEGMTPRYTYKMKEGITADRHGMLIIENERILEIIQS